MDLKVLIFIWFDYNRGVESGQPFKANEMTHWIFFRAFGDIHSVSLGAAIPIASKITIPLSA